MDEDTLFESAVASTVLGTILAAIATIRPQPMIYEVEVSDLFAVCFFIAGVISLLTIIQAEEKNGIIVTVILLVFSVIIEFGSPETLASLLPVFFIGDFILGGIAWVKRKWGMGLL